MMMALALGVMGVLGGVTGWAAWKASARLATWGENMNECDQIFQRMSEEEDEAAPVVVRGRVAAEARRPLVPDTFQPAPHR